MLGALGDQKTETRPLVELRENEKKILQVLKGALSPRTGVNVTGGGAVSVDYVADESDLAHSAVMRSSLSLEAANLVRISERKKTKVSLSEEGRAYAKWGLPERRVIEALIKMGGEAPIENVWTNRQPALREEDQVITIGWLIRKRWAEIDKKDGKLKSSRRKPPPQGKDEELLSLLKEKGTAILEDLSNKMREDVSVLKRRKLVNTRTEAIRELSLTEESWTLPEGELKIAQEISQLTPELIASGRWREVNLIKYDTKAPVAHVWPGKKHPYLRFLDELKRKLVALGFREMVGPAVELSFFNCDGLFMPQDHPARDIHDMYFVKEPEYGSLDRYRQFLENVRKTHENGWKTGSKGWTYAFSMLEAARLMLRSQTTSVSARTLISSELEIPGKYFSIARCYRPDVVDKTHLTEFNQVEGIVLGEALTLRDLLGVLERFAVDVAGADKVKYRPDYFPFTEPSVELVAYKEGYGWLEFGGSGIFRPEVTLPLDIRVPVLAWGLGADRLFMMKTGIDDMRYLFGHDLEWIRRRELV